MSNSTNPDAVAKAPGTDELTPSDFAEFFTDIHGHEPFPWQERLTTHVLERRAWPGVIDLPTGTGKTAVLDTAVFAMAAQPMISPRRVVFVIDRRIVVDQVYKRAQRIRDRIETGDTPVLKVVRDSLRKLSDGKALGIAALRGGIPLDNEWTHRPDQPWVVVSTVDQFGSRLLFRGYGVRPGMRPIHAGLAGNDCLVVLDEVHLSVPFAETLGRVAALPRGELPRRFTIVEMSATPSDKGTERFTLDSAEDMEGCEELKRRVYAKKQAELETAGNQDGIPATVLKIIKQIEQSNRKGHSNILSVGVVVNRVRTACETHDLLKADYSTHLITGRMRPLDRVNVLDKIAPIVDPDSAQRGGQFTIVVATQAIEVGADFSFDSLITECAPVDSLRQRFGRLDRRGSYYSKTCKPAKAWIIGPTSVVTSNKPDPIYGESVKATWDELKRRCGERGIIDIGPLSLRDFPDESTAPSLHAPLLQQTHMDAWTQTRPEPILDPPIVWFLHGINQDRAADVSVLWRWDRSTEGLRLVPPRQAEFLQIPFSAAKSWLSGGPVADVADISQTLEEESATSRSTMQNVDWVRWEGFDGGVNSKVNVNDILPGDVLVVDPRRGGLNAGTWNHLSNEVVADLGDAAQIEFGRRATLRLDMRLPHIVDPPTPSSDAESDTPITEHIREWLQDWKEESSRKPETAQLAQWIVKTVERLGSNFDLNSVGVDSKDSGNVYYVLTERHQQTKKPIVDITTMDGSDQTGSQTGTGTPLARHLDGVGKRAAKIATHLCLPPEIVEDLCLAGRLHDLGKVDPRFQLQLIGGDSIGLLEVLSVEPLAKSLPGTRKGNSGGYPKGMRHELASIAMIESNADVLSLAHDRDLVLHLVGTHHGWGRPLPPIIEDPEPQMLSYVLDGKTMEANSDLGQGGLALDMADRFWRLVDCYGYHGLAWLEAILRLADHRQSAKEAGVS
ncbi:MAG: type I-U CRISPR-associated helicase/endonuclease Cas3 [Halieaceae bacterium]|nr:type I-U CRISPR-associated helicase/endonuclease Cas3 [Halieaceae bacterium]